MNESFANAPIVRVTLEGMRAELRHFFAGYAETLEDAIKAEIDKQVTPEAVQALAEAEVRNAIHAWVREVTRDALQTKRDRFQKSVLEAAIRYIEEHHHLY